MWKIWIQAARPQTLAASVVPVVTGASLAWSAGAFHLAASTTALWCALLIQIGTNFANDYFDFQKGADSDDRIGFQRATAAGLISPHTMLQAAILVMTAAFISGLYLVWIGGWVILWIGLLSLLFGFLYTGGPWPLAYNGLGDLFVFLFFGIIAVMGTYYVNTLEWSTHALVASLPIGALCVNILVVNNLRDVEQDAAAGKRTLGVLFGETALKLEYTLMLGIALLTPFLFWLMLGFSAWILLPLLSIMMAAGRLRTVWQHQDKQHLNRTLERSAQLMVLYGFLLSAGFLLQSF